MRIIYNLVSIVLFLHRLVYTFRYVNKYDEYIRIAWGDSYAVVMIYALDVFKKYNLQLGERVYGDSNGDPNSHNFVRVTRQIRYTDFVVTNRAIPVESVEGRYKLELIQALLRDVEAYSDDFVKVTKQSRLGEFTELSAEIRLVKLNHENFGGII